MVNTCPLLLDRINVFLITLIPSDNFIHNPSISKQHPDGFWWRERQSKHAEWGLSSSFLYFPFWGYRFWSWDRSKYALLSDSNRNKLEHCREDRKFYFSLWIKYFISTEMLISDSQNKPRGTHKCLATCLHGTNSICKILKEFPSSLLQNCCSSLGDLCRFLSKQTWNSLVSLVCTVTNILNNLVTDFTFSVSHIE